MRRRSGLWMVRAPRVARSGIPFVPTGLSGLVNAGDIDRPVGEGDVSSDRVFGPNERLHAGVHVIPCRAQLSLLLGKMRGGRQPLGLRGQSVAEEQTRVSSPSARCRGPLHTSAASWDTGHAARAWKELVFAAPVTNTTSLLTVQPSRNLGTLLIPPSPAPTSPSTNPAGHSKSRRGQLARIAPPSLSPLPPEQARYFLCCFLLSGSPGLLAALCSHPPYTLASAKSSLVPYGKPALAPVACRTKCGCLSLAWKPSRHGPSLASGPDSQSTSVPIPHAK